MRASVLRRLGYYGSQSSRAFVGKVAMRPPQCRAVPKLFRGGVICAFVLPLAIISVPEKKATFKLPKGVSRKYDQAARDVIEYTNWEKTLLSCDEEKFREVIGYIAYCKLHVPELIPVINQFNTEGLLHRIIRKDIADAELFLKSGSKGKFKPTWLGIYNETIGLDNLPDIRRAFYILGDYTRGPDRYGDVYEYFIDNIKKPENRAEIFEGLLDLSPSPYVFRCIQKYNVTGKLISPRYSKYAYKFSNFKYLADNDMVDPSGVVDYLEVAVNSTDNSPEDKRQILTYLLALNPDPSAKRAMTFALRDLLKNATEREMRFISSLIKRIGYEFTAEEKNKFQADANQSYKKLKYYEGFEAAEALAKYIRKNHPEFGVISLDPSKRKRRDDDD
ncbi:MAG: hypothetical protein Hyperionvirus6_62 [Hyperionvirus sp.]|uniref:Uncharacterized protein n=1 Tax=Hyperionvirus sp. TaxID=2487770 RepID=A0A3G5AAY9_9VIRU|nr:MAG: hypothetical protein Hyperionvirus6_62 [Hyperionvirus sp.]